MINFIKWWFKKKDAPDIYFTIFLIGVFIGGCLLPVFGLIALIGIQIFMISLILIGVLHFVCVRVKSNIRDYHAEQEKMLRILADDSDKDYNYYRKN